MKIECTLKEFNRITSDASCAIPREMKIESTSRWPQKTVRLIIDNKEIELDPQDLINAVKNCTNW